MPTEILEEILIPATTSQIPPLTLFTYPTRLASAWQPEILEIHCPAYALPQPEIKIPIYAGSTATLGIQRGSRLRQWYKKWKEPLDLGETYLLDTRYETDKNIAHILKNVSPALRAVQHLAPHIPKVTVILRQRAPELAKTAYEYLGAEVLCTDREVTGRIIQGRTGKDGAYENYYQDWYGNLTFPGLIQDTPSRIFIGRKGARAIQNEADLEPLLQRYGFHKFYYEDIPLAQQWSLTKNAEVVIAAHGAAMASLMLNRQGVKVIELFHPGYVTHSFRHTTIAVGGSWCGVTGQMPPDIIQRLDFEQKARYFAGASMTIHPDALQKALDHLAIAPSIPF